MPVDVVGAQAGTSASGSADLFGCHVLAAAGDLAGVAVAVVGAGRIKVIRGRLGAGAANDSRLRFWLFDNLRPSRHLLDQFLYLVAVRRPHQLLCQVGLVLGVFDSRVDSRFSRRGLCDRFRLRLAMPPSVTEHQTLGVDLAVLRALLCNSCRGRLGQHHQSRVGASLGQLVGAHERVVWQALDRGTVLVQPLAELDGLTVAAAEHALTSDGHQLPTWLDHIPGMPDMRRIGATTERRVHQHVVIDRTRLEVKKIPGTQFVALGLQQRPQLVADLDGVHLGAGLLCGVSQVAAASTWLQHDVARLDASQVGHSASQSLRCREKVDANLLSDQRAFGDLDRVGLLRAIAVHDVLGQRQSQVQVCLDADAMQACLLGHGLLIPPAQA